MSLTLLTQNRIELAAAVVTSNPIAREVKPTARLYDRDKSLQYEGSSAAQTDIDVDLGAAYDISAWAMWNHTVSGVTAVFYADAATIGTTSRDSLDPAAANFLRTFTSDSVRYLRARFPAMADVPKIGELFAGSHYSIEDPEYGTEEEQVGNVRRDESPGGFVWKAQLGDARYRLRYAWENLSDTGWADLKAAYDQTQQGVKAFPMVDVDGTVRWVEFEEGTLRRTRGFKNKNVVTVSFLEVL